MPAGGAKPEDLLAGLVAQMRLVGKIAGQLGKDAGRPNVPQFGRELYHIDLPQVVPSPSEPSDRGEQSKYAVLGAQWPSKPRFGFMQRALETYKAELERQAFRAIVFDYDGTLCSSHRNELRPPDSILKQLTRLVEEGVIVGIASGRGGSIPEHLQKCLPKHLWSKVQLGLYNGGLITNVGGPPNGLGKTSEFLSHVTRIVSKLKTLGVPIEKIRTTHPYQVSVRFREGLATEQMWFVIADALRQAGLDLSSMVRSKHSVDILGTGVSKSRLIAHIIQELKIDPYQVLTMGDLGAWPGNDSALLEHRFSLSVDIPSRRLDRGWNLAPPHKRDVDATMWYLERLRTTSDGTFRMELSNHAVPTIVDSQ
jgi:HAD superfamily hydrolase (TIGR01484 family)